MNDSHPLPMNEGPVLPELNPDAVAGMSPRFILPDLQGEGGFPIGRSEIGGLTSEIGERQGRNPGHALICEVRRCRFLEGTQGGAALALGG